MTEASADARSGVPPQRRSRTAQLLFGVAVAAALAAEFADCWRRYGEFVSLTRARHGSVWPDGRPVALDFIQFAAVAEAWERGRIDELYASTGSQHELMTLAAELPSTFNFLLNFNYPPFVAWLLKPLASLDYMQRLAAWTAIQLCFAAVALACWRAELNHRAFWIVALVWLLSPPVISTLTVGQTSFMALASMSGTLLLLNRRRDFAAGLVLATLFYKPTLGIVLGPLLVAAGRWRVVLGVAVGAFVLAAASAAVSMKACKDYPKMTRELWIVATSYAEFYARHFNLLAFVSTLSGRTPEEFNWVRRALVVVPSAALLIATAKAWCRPWRPGTPQWSAGAAAAVLTTLVATPYLFAYDTVIASVAAVYSARTWDLRPEWHRWFILGCLVVAGGFVAGGNSLLEWMRDRWHFRLQLAPIALTAWAALELRWARHAARRSA